jgi:hypothetical protein
MSQAARWLPLLASCFAPCIFAPLFSTYAFVPLTLQYCNKEEDKDLQKVQENNKRTLKALQKQLRASEGPAITFTVKPVKAKKGKKAPKEQDTE